jgi:hypothetical protein
VLEERRVDGARRVRIAEGMWVSRVTQRGWVVVDAPGPRRGPLQRRQLALAVKVILTPPCIFH